MTMQRLSGWGRTAWTVADVINTTDENTIRSTLAAAGDRGAIARGLGRSYGAAAQNAGGTVVEITSEHDPMGIDAVLDPISGILDVASSVSLDSILRRCVPRGWFVPVTPGTRFVTVGGSIASDVQGKNHHFDGSFGQHVLSMTVMLSSGEIVELSPEVNPAWFWATVGGMGLTGIVIRASLQMLRIESSQVRVETER
jgi:decaprenylphospho-beta-D-ribofuranose 2-oxidase